MKILAIRGKNLASLEGKFEIDFTTEPLKSAGIFAITGCTGAGKSTLLDALCLALFDETPRNNRASENINIIDVKEKTISQKDSRNILRRGSVDGYAEVDFVSLGREKFRTRWSVRRARDRAEGSLQSSEIRLTNLTSGMDLGGRKTELLSKIVELIGLTYDQFTRAVLLAQGDFATFLKATQKEKAELLEKLTGTDIYSKISSSIFDKSKSAEFELKSLRERMNDIELLSDEDLEKQLAERQTILQETTVLKTNVMNISAKIKWITDAEVIRKGIASAQELCTDAENAILNAKPRYNYLAQVDSVQEIRDSFTELKTTQKQLDHDKATLSKLQDECEANALSLKKVSRKAVTCEMELQKHNEAFAALKPQIRQAREFDIRAAGAKSNTDEARKEYEAARESYINLEEVLSNKEQLLKAQNEDLKKLEEQQIELQAIVPTEAIALREKLEQGKPCSVCGSISHPYKDMPNEISQMDIKEIARRWKENLEQHTASQQRIANLVGELSAGQESFAIAKENLLQKRDKLIKETAVQEELQKSRMLLLDGKSADEVEKTCTAKGKELTDFLQKIIETKNTLTARSENYAGTIAQISADITSLSERSVVLQNIVDGWLATKGSKLTKGELSELLAKDSVWLTAERGFLNSLSQNKTTAIATLKERNANLENHLAAEIKPSDDESREYLGNELKAKNALIEQKSARMTEIDILLSNHHKGKERIKELEKELEQKRALAENWKKLNEMFGSADGAKFKVLAQGYTLEALLLYANKHLKELSKRYELQRIPDTLALQVVDLDMLGEIRTIHSLSGGESFLISLALALGLSSLSSNRMKVESLFIDEGFGSLDIDTLRVAMDALEQLQTQGRKIGVISHVAEMTERITTQIKVIKTANGRSHIEVV